MRRRLLAQASSAISTADRPSQINQEQQASKKAKLIAQRTASQKFAERKAIEEETRLARIQELKETVQKRRREVLFLFNLGCRQFQ